MSYLLFGFVFFIAMYGLLQFIWAIRCAFVGRGFKSNGDMFFRILLITISTLLVVWLGPVALTGIGLL